MEHNVAPLPKGTQVDEYIIDQVMGGGGFSIVYNAHLVSDASRTVLIKEFMPKNWLRVLMLRKSPVSIPLPLKPITKGVNFFSRKLKHWAL